MLSHSNVTLCIFPHSFIFIFCWILCLCNNVHVFMLKYCIHWREKTIISYCLCLKNDPDPLGFYDHLFFFYFEGFTFQLWNVLLHWNSHYRTFAVSFLSTLGCHWAEKNLEEISRSLSFYILFMLGKFSSALYKATCEKQDYVPYSPSPQNIWALAMMNQHHSMTPELQIFILQFFILNTILIQNVFFFNLKRLMVDCQNSQQNINKFANVYPQSPPTGRTMKPIGH